MNKGETKRAMLKCAAKKIIVCDHSKFGQAANANFASPDEIDIGICDRKPEEKVMEVFRQSDVRLIVAK